VCSAPRDDVDPKRVLFADRVVVLSRHTERRFLSAGIAASTLRLIRPSIAPLAAPSAEDRRGMRERLGWPADAPIVVYAGDFEFGRGAALAIEAHSALPRELGAWLVMACRTKTPAARARELELKQLAEQLGCMSSMRWLGETPRIHEVLAAADVVTLPTDTLYAKMDLPLVLVEAMALERPVLIGSGTPAEELAEGEAACVAATDRDAVLAATRALLEDAEARKKLGARARVAALERYGAPRMAAQYEALYDELIA
jgi:phosphatidylinositol alpha-1,6-mannosyltransferase